MGAKPANGRGSGAKCEAVKAINSGELKDSIAVAQITKSYNTTGEVIVKVTNSLLEELNIKKEPVFICFNELPVPFYIASYTKRGNNGAIVKFETIDSLKQSEELIKSTLYILKSSLSAKQQREAFEQDIEAFLTGCLLIDAEGEPIGTVTGFFDYSSNPCIEVALNKGKRYLLSEQQGTDKGEKNNKAEIPFNEKLIIEFNAEARTLVMEIPKGLII